MRIAYFTESLPPLIDGVTRTLTQLAMTLEQEKVEFRFFAPVRPDTTFPWRHRVHTVGSITFPFYRYYRVGLPYFQGVETALDTFNPDLVHVTSPTPLGIYGMKYARKCRLGVVSSYHTHFVSYMDYYGFRSTRRWGWKFLQWFHNQGFKTFVPSRSAAAEVTQHGFKHVELWPRGIDIEVFSPQFRSDLLRQSVVRTDEPILLFVGRLVKEKDIDDLIEACRILQEMGNRFRMVLVGDGPMRQEISLRLPQAHLLGFLSGRELAEWYASADLFLFPSTTETFGNVILEAFASGLPAIGVAKGGVADLITPGVNGILAPPHSPPELAAKIQVLLNDVSYRTMLAERARQTATQYSWREINLKLVQNYQQVLDEPRN